MLDQEFWMSKWGLPEREEFTRWCYSFKGSFTEKTFPPGNKFTWHCNKLHNLIVIYMRHYSGILVVFTENSLCARNTFWSSPEDLTTGCTVIKLFFSLIWTAEFLTVAYFHFDFEIYKCQSPRWRIKPIGTGIEMKSDKSSLPVATASAGCKQHNQSLVVLRV